MRTLRGILLGACLGSVSCSATATVEPDAATVVSLPTAVVGAPPVVVSGPTGVSQPAPGAPPAPPTPTGSPPLDHKPCDTRAAGNNAVDINGDGKPDVFKVSSGGRVVCRAIDLNFDGALDVYNYFAPNGTVERVERDLDGDGQIDTIVFRVDGSASCVELVDHDADGRAESAERVECAAKLKP